jgi:hypothetical protein
MSEEVKMGRSNRKVVRSDRGVLMFNAAVVLVMRNNSVSILDCSIETYLERDWDDVKVRDAARSQRCK